VCSGPFKFVERVAQDRIVLERYDGYWNKAQVFFDKLVYTPIVDSTVRLANLKSGQFDIIERVASSDIERLEAEKKFKVTRITEIGYQGITVNVGKSDQAKNNALGKDSRVREAFELAIDRQGLAQVVMDNEATVGNQWVAPNNAYYAKNMPVPKRDVARAKALLKEAGMPNPTVTLMTPTTSDAQRLALVVQAMMSEVDPAALTPLQHSPDTQGFIGDKAENRRTEESFGIGTAPGPLKARMLRTASRRVH